MITFQEMFNKVKLFGETMKGSYTIIVDKEGNIIYTEGNRGELKLISDIYHILLG